MHNYYNIIPAILIDVFIILIFEGLLFFLYLEKKEENIITSQLDNNLQNAIRSIGNKQNIDTINTVLKSMAVNKVLNPLDIQKDAEKNYIEKTRTKGIIIFISVVFGVLLLLLLYKYIVVDVFNNTINWFKVGIIVSFTISLIIIMEILYIMYVLFNKKFNDSEIELYFLKAIIS